MKKDPNKFKPVTFEHQLAAFLLTFGQKQMVALVLCVHRCCKDLISSLDSVGGKKFVHHLVQSAFLQPMEGPQA